MAYLLRSIETNDGQSDLWIFLFPIDIDHAKMVFSVRFTYAKFIGFEIGPFLGQAARRHVVQRIEPLNVTFLNLTPVHIALNEHDSLSSSCSNKVDHFLLLARQIGP